MIAYYAPLAAVQPFASPPLATANITFTFTFCFVQCDPDTMVTKKEDFLPGMFFVCNATF